MIIGTPIPHNAHIPAGYVKSLLQVKNYSHIFQEGPSIPDNRNKIFETARVMGESLLFIDSDMVFTPEDVKRIEKHLETMDIVTGVCIMGFPGFPAAIFDEKFKVIEPKDGVFEVGACGAAFLGISRKVLHTLIDPFSLIKSPGGQFYGEDISFCIRAKEHGFKVYCDGDLHIGHIKTKVIYHGDK